MSFSGLTEREAEAAKQKYGMNVRSYKNSFGSCVVRELSSLTFRLLVISALLETVSLMLGLLEVTAPHDPLPRIFVTAFAAFAIAMIGAVIKYNSGKTLHDAFCSAPKGTYTVFRGMDKTVEIPAGEIVVGDLIFVSKGDIIPADGTIIDGTVTVEQSALGLSAKIEKTAANEGYRSTVTNLKDSYGVYCGSSVCSGSAVVRITAVGDNTQLAKRSEKAAPEIPEGSFSPTLKTAAAAGIISAAAVTIVCAISGALSGEFLAGLLRGLSAAAIALAAICAGGKALICNALAAISAESLKRRGVSLLKAESLVSAGKTDILMTERTGMITEGKYSVSGFIDGSGKEYQSFSSIGGNLGKLVKTAVAGAAQAEILPDGTVRGRDPFDNAMLGFVKNKGGNKRDKDKVKKQAEASENGVYGVTVTMGNGLATIIRGEPGKILDRCGEYFGADGKKHKITNKNALPKLADAIALSGKDVAAFAFSGKGIKGGSIPAGGFVFIGFMALQDSYLEESGEAVKKLKKMGVRTILVTSVGRKNAIFTVKYAGIKKSGGAVLDPEQLGKMKRSEIAERLDNINAVTEASSRDKLRLMTAAKLKEKKICLAGSFTDDIAALAEADTAFASSSAAPAVAEVCGASADGCGISCAAEFISESRKFAGGYKTWIIFRTVIAVAIALFTIFLK